MTDNDFVPLILNCESASQWNVVYSSIRDGQTTHDAVMEDTGLSKSHIDESIKGLVAMELITDRNEPYEVNSLINVEGVAERIRYRVTGLHGLMQQYQPDNWGRHAGVHLHYEFLMKENEQYFRDDNEGLWKRIRNWEREKGYEPRKKNGKPYEFNTKKWTHWTVIADHLGLIRKTKGSFYTTYFDPNNLKGALMWYSEQEDTTTFPISSFINWLDDNIVPCSVQGKAVPTPIEQPLHLLARTGWLKFVEEGDTGTANLSGIEPNQYPDSVNSISIIES